MASSTLDTDVEADCGVESSERDLEYQPAGFQIDSTTSARQLTPVNRSFQDFGIDLRKPVNCTGSGTRVSGPFIQATRDICDDMIEDGAHVVFDWDNTLKLYNKETRQLSCRVSKQFLLHLKHNRRCRLYIISAIRPSALNLDTLLFEVDRLGLTDVFTSSAWDDVDGMQTDKAVVKPEYAHKGNVIICGYDKAETFLKLSKFNSARGDKVSFFDDEEWNINNFSVLVPNSRCYLCK